MKTLFDYKVSLADDDKLQIAMNQAPMTQVQFSLLILEMERMMTVLKAKYWRQGFEVLRESGN